MEIRELNSEIYLQPRWNDMLRTKVPDVVDVEDVRLKARRAQVGAVMKDIAMSLR